MARKYIDCRDFPESKCSASFGADSDDELMAVAMEHATKTHGYTDTPETKEKLRKAFTKECHC